MVLRAGQRSSPDCDAAMEKLCRVYWYPIYAFVRRQGRSAHDAQDLTQEFFARLIKNQIIARATPEKGKFRSFLLATLKNFLSDEWDKVRAEKRGGRCTTFSLDDLAPEQRYSLEPTTDVTPETLFHRKWALIVLDAAINRLKAECAASGKGRNFDLLKQFLTTEPEKSDYSRLSGELGVKPNTLAVTVHRLRARFGELVRAEIADTVTSPQAVDEEIKSLFA